MLSPTDQNNLMHEYKDLYFKKYKIKLSDQEALAKAVLLVEFWRIIRRPVRKLNENNNQPKN